MLDRAQQHRAQERCTVDFGVGLTRPGSTHAADFEHLNCFQEQRRIDDGAPKQHGTVNLFVLALALGLLEFGFPEPYNGPRNNIVLVVPQTERIALYATPCQHDDYSTRTQIQRLDRRSCRRWLWEACRLYYRLRPRKSSRKNRSLLFYIHNILRHKVDANASAVSVFFKQTE